jgi:2-polyprenyl-6-hydroxyphenyl methylase/3-demethylubiquinone-9 3-methyltransferase
VITLSEMPVDNAMYDRLADTWWDENAWLHLLRTSVNPARLAVLREAVAATGLAVRETKALDVGCGGGLMAEEVARMGFAVTGIDPSTASIDTARRHATEAGLLIDYRVGKGEALPVTDEEFDFVYCCDVLEHVDSVPQVLSEIRRALRRGGLFVYDTINRTPVSKLVMIKLFQEWESTRVVAPGLHDYDMFIKPSELRSALVRARLEPRGKLDGIKPAANPLALVRLLRAQRSGRITVAEFGKRAQMRRSRDKSVLYAGYAIAV